MLPFLLQGRAARIRRTTGASGAFSEEIRVLGRDIFFDGNTHVAPGGDWLTVEAIEHVRRSMIRRICVTPKTYRQRPSYGAGLSAYVKKPFTRTTESQMVARIKEQVSLMRQIERVYEVTLTERADGSGVPFVEVFVRAKVLGSRVDFRPFLVPRDA